MDSIKVFSCGLNERGGFKGLFFEIDMFYFFCVYLVESYSYTFTHRLITNHVLSCSCIVASRNASTLKIPFTLISQMRLELSRTNFILRMFHTYYLTFTSPYST